MKKIFFIVSIIAFSLHLFSQNPVLSEDVDLNIEKPKFGENRKHFTQFYASLGAILGKSEGDIMEVNSWKSSYFDLGFRYKLRLFEYNAVGFQIYYNYYSFRLKYESEFELPIIVHDKDKIRTSNFGLGIYDRINFGKRGDHLGKYLDLGAYGEIALSRIHYYKQKQTKGEVLKAELSKLNALEKLNYGVFANIGFNKYVIFGKYRLSDMISDKTRFDEMPRLVIGLQIGF